jgi:DNA polymerase-3 subunit epsilon
MSINLNNIVRPIVFLKVSTTGINPKRDRIVEMSLVKVGVDRKTEKGTRLINPGMPIPPEATAIHGVTDADVAGKPSFADIARGVYSFVEGCDFAGYDIEGFDLRFLIEELNRAGIGLHLHGKNVINISSVYHALNPTDINAAYQKYCGKQIESDVIRTEEHNLIAAQILNGMMSQHNGQVYKSKKTGEHTIEATPQFLNNVFRKKKNALDIEGKIVVNDNGAPQFTFGKFKGRTIQEAIVEDAEYVHWISTDSELLPDAKYLIKNIVERTSKSTVNG